MAYQPRRWTFRTAGLIGALFAAAIGGSIHDAHASQGCNQMKSGALFIAASDVTGIAAAGTNFDAGDMITASINNGTNNDTVHLVTANGVILTVLGGSFFSYTVPTATSETLQIVFLTGGRAGAVLGWICAPSSAALTLVSLSSATTQVGQAYSQTNVASGGTTPYTYSVSAGTPPAGTSLDTSTGTVSGTPTTAGAFSYTIEVTDGTTPTAQTATQVVSGTIAPTTLGLTSTPSATTQVGQSYSQTNVASGGTMPYTYSLFAGTLPAGTTLNTSTGTVSGMPTTAGAFNYAVKVTDSTTPTAQTATQVVNGTIGTATTNTSITSSLNPSAVGQSVTFTATITTGGGTAMGTVTFKDGTTTLGTGTVSGNKATFSTVSLTLGVHLITAIYGGDGNFTASTSAALQQSVAVPADSMKLRAMQTTVTPLIAQISGQAITGAIDNAIEDGFNDNPQPLTPNGNGFTFNFGAEGNGQRSAAVSNNGVRDFVNTPDRRANRIDDAFSALAYGGQYTKAPPRPTTLQRDWLGWVDLRGSSVDRRSTGNDLKGDQINATAGLTRKLTPDMLVGAFGGYEHFDYTSDALTGRLKGDGWTVGSYFGWRFAPTMRFDAAVARSGINFDGTAGTASATFPGSRWLASGGLTGTYRWPVVVFQPSARVYAMWEHENGYADSLGIVQDARNFTTGRASGGTKVGYPFEWSGVALTPYVGVYGDYYFTSDDASLASTPLLQGWSARFTTGIATKFANGGQISAGGELGGIGSSSNTTMWTYRARGSVPF